ncbi:hypothetical protein EW146_g2054 [Bondarzewia mesenterica]|uniref:Uncharacterized protein n=1 Tax=Bondarzewia mesenterica TaxID=1095465 RepID=A0A4V6S1J4_9AGAM|nr:hypothetical protein EW146_g2054 [Bondarzewia mesenterica]
MGDDTSHELLFRVLAPLPSSQHIISDSMPSIAEELPPDSPASTAIPTAPPRTPSKDTVSMISALPRDIRRRSSHLQRWIEDQLSFPNNARAGDNGSSTDTPLYATAPHPYLAYPGISRPRFGEDGPDDSHTLESYVLVDEDEARSSRRGLDEDVFQSRSTDTDRIRSSPALSTTATPRPNSGLFQAPPSLRNFRLSLAPSRRASAAARNAPFSSVPRDSFLQRHNANTQTNQKRESSVTSLASAQPSSPDGPSTPRTSRSYSSWKFKRPNVLGVFSSSPHSHRSRGDSSDEMPPSRPSFSSVNTFSSSTTGTSNISTSHKGPVRSSRSPPPPRFKTPSPSLWSLPSNASHLHDPPGSETMLSLKPSTGIRIPFSIKGHGSSIPIRRVPSVLISQEKRKKKLVVSGVGMNDQRRVEGVRRCLLEKSIRSRAPKMAISTSISGGLRSLILCADSMLGSISPELAVSRCRGIRARNIERNLDCLLYNYTYTPRSFILNLVDCNAAYNHWTVTTIYAFMTKKDNYAHLVRLPFFSASVYTL